MSLDKQEMLRAKAIAPVHITRLIASWDTCDIAQNQVRYLMEEDEETQRRMTEEELTESKLFDEVCSDSDLYDMEYHDMVDYLTEYINKLNPDGYWKAEVSNFGWRSLNGHKYFSADTGSELLREILPQTDCTYKIYRVRARKWLAVQNSHHDSPCGREWYVIKPCSQRTYEENRY